MIYRERGKRDSVLIVGKSCLLLVPVWFKVPVPQIAEKLSFINMANIGYFSKQYFIQG